MSKQTSVIGYVKQIKKLLFNLDNKVGFEKEREVQNVFHYIHNVVERVDSLRVTTTKRCTRISAFHVFYSLLRRIGQ